MRNRLRKAREASGRALLAAWALIASVIGFDEIAIAVGLALVAFGLWDVWRPGAFILPGMVILWMAVPSRPAFITRPPVLVKRVRKD